MSNLPKVIHSDASAGKRAQPTVRKSAHTLLFQTLGEKSKVAPPYIRRRDASSINVQEPFALPSTIEELKRRLRLSPAEGFG